MFKNKDTSRISRHMRQQRPRPSQGNQSDGEMYVNGTNSFTNNVTPGHQKRINSNIVSSDIMPIQKKNIYIKETERNEILHIHTQ